MLSTAHPQAKQPATPKTVRQLTQREMALYDVIVDYKRANDGCAPDHRELMALADISSTSVVAHYLDHLERAGLITRRQGSRQIHVRGGQWTLNS